jgi:hypothetical protein
MSEMAIFQQFKIQVRLSEKWGRMGVKIGAF